MPNSWLHTFCRKPAAPRKPKPAPGPPTRHSRRQGGEAPAQLSEQEAQLAAMYVDGVCPKCGKVCSSDSASLGLQRCSIMLEGADLQNLWPGAAASTLA